MSGAIAGGLVGGFSGFIANIVQDRQTLQRHTRNIASALTGEIEALCQYIVDDYLTKLCLDLDSPDAGLDRYPYHGFRGERDYISVFRSLGANVGALPSPLPRDLVHWYTGLAVCLERARELHDLAATKDSNRIGEAREIAQAQHASFIRLVEFAKLLCVRLSSI